MHPLDEFELKVFEATGDIGATTEAMEFIRAALLNHEIDMDDLPKISVIMIDKD